MPETMAGASDWALDCLAERLGATRNVATARRPRAVFIAPPVAWVTTAFGLEELVRANRGGSAETHPSFTPGTCELMVYNVGQSGRYPAECYGSDGGKRDRLV